MPSPSLTADIERLQASVTSLLALISHCQSSLSLLTSSINPTIDVAPPTAPNCTTEPANTPPLSIAPLSLLHDTATLTRAHTTKLALLLTQAPLSSTTSAATKLISTIQTSVLPPLITSLELLHSRNHGKIILHEVSRSLVEVLHGLKEMVGGPLRAMVLDALATDGDKAGAAVAGEKETVILPSTGRIWAACDKLIAIRAKGLAGVVSDRLRSSAETVTDATEELKEYLEKHSPPAQGPSVATSASSSSVGDSDQDNDEDDQDFWSDTGDFPSISTPPTSRRKRKPLPASALEQISATIKRLKTISILLQAIQKRRLVSGPSPDPANATDPDGEVVRRLDGMADAAEEIVILVDEVVAEFYDLDEDEEEEGVGGVEQEPAPVPTNMEVKLIRKALELADLATLAWDGSTDVGSRLFEECGKAVQR